jgi:hypothetical protein
LVFDALLVSVSVAKAKINRQFNNHGGIYKILKDLDLQVS